MPSDSNSGRQLQLILFAMLALVIIIGGGWLASRNLSQGRGDREGAWKLACWVAAIMMGVWLTEAHFTVSIGTFGMFLVALASAIFYAYTIYVMYIALEPHLRRRWPRTLISWTAILNGQWRDPIVGRDVLIGIVCGLGIDFMAQGVDALALGSNVSPHTRSLDVLQGLRSTLGILFEDVPRGMRGFLLFFLVLFLLRAILRNQWLAVAAFIAIFSLQDLLVSHHPVIDGAENLVSYAAIALVAWRFGLLAIAMLFWSTDLIENMQATLHGGAWYLGETLFLIACIVALAVWACYTSMAGQKLWKTNLLET